MVCPGDDRFPAFGGNGISTTVMWGMRVHTTERGESLLNFGIVVHRFSRPLVVLIVGASLVWSATRCPRTFVTWGRITTTVVHVANTGDFLNILLQNHNEGYNVRAANVAAFGGNAGSCGIWRCKNK
jgi:hypothetical protein